MLLKKFALGLPLLLLSAASWADEAPVLKDTQVSVFGGYTYWDGERNLDDDSIWGVGFNKKFHEKWYAGIWLGRSNVRNNNTNTRTDNTHMGLRVTHYPLVAGSLQPYLSAGYTTLRTGGQPEAEKSSSMTDISAGIDWQFCSKRDAVLFTEYRQNFSSGSGNRYSDGQLFAGLKFGFSSKHTDHMASKKSSQTLAAERKAASDALHFGFDSVEISDATQAELAEVGAYLKKHPEKRASLVGHTDISGNANYNVKLSERRAAAVAEHLALRYDLSREQLDISGQGAKQPIADNDTHEGRIMNRRVEVSVLD